MSVQTTNLGTVVSWRVGGGRGVDPSGRFWRRGPMAGPGGRSTRRWAAGLAALTIALGLVMVLTVWMFSLLQLPRPARLVLIGAGYHANLQIPQNPAGWAGLRDLAGLADRPSSSWVARLCGARYLRDGDPILLDNRARERWSETLRAVEEPTVIVVMAMHGGVDRDGPYLLPEDATAVPESANRLRVADVLRAMAGLPRAKKKVLILEATGLPYDWELGMLRNDFAAAMAGLDAEVRKVPNLVVINSSGAGERSWASEAWGRPAFLHFLVDALTGEGAATSGRVNLEKVCDEVATRLKTWAARHRGASQRPLILPAGEGWRALARSIELPPVRGPSTSTTPAVASGVSIEEGALVRWDEYRELEASSPMPGLVSPIAWRRYQQFLRRFDERLRAVGPEDDRDRAEVLAALESQRLDLKQGRSQRLAGARSAALTMPMAEGAAGSDGAPMDPAAPGRDVRAWFDGTWWALSGAEAAKAWQERKAREPGGDARNLAAQLGGLLLDKVIDDPVRNLDRAARLAQILDPASHRPAELNFLVMLGGGLPPGWQSTDAVDLVRRAIRVRRLAERAAIGVAERTEAADQLRAGPMVAAWIAPKVEEGDRHRREAEDLLMATDGREACSAAYDRAEAAYAAATRGAGVVRRGILARDRALSDLVPIDEWLAAWYPPTDQAELLGQFVEAAEGLWGHVHDLARALERPEFAAIESGLDRMAAEVERAHAGLRSRIEDRLNLWLKEAEDPSQAHRSSAELRGLVDALTLPWLGRELRTAILRHGLVPLRRRDREDGPAPSTVATASGDVELLVGYRRRLAMAMLGNRGAVADVGDVAEAGRRLSTALHGRIDEIARRIGQDDAPRGTDWAEALASIDLLIRALDVAGNEQVRPLAGPAVSLSSLRLEDYLIGQASRTWADLWHDEGMDVVPYDRRVAGAYLDDARDFDARLRGARGDRIRAVRDRIARGEGVRLDGPPSMVVTSELRGGVDYRVVADDLPELRGGLAVAWFEGGGGFAIEGSSGPSGRRAVRLGGPTSGRLDVSLQFPGATADPGSTPAASTSTLAARAYFRGRRIATRTIVDRRPTPSRRIVRTRPEPGGGVVVRADPGLIREVGLGAGAVAIVLDATGSMRGPSDRPMDGKFREATGALRSVLERLPRGTVVSLWVFGEAMGEPKTAAVAERTIRRLEGPVAWNPSLLVPWMSDLAAIEPWNKSPILRAMLLASEDLRGAPGFKSLLVLTDGEDNCWRHDHEMNPGGLDVSTAMAARFAGSGIAVNVIGYRVRTAEEQAKVRRQFEGSGHFVTAEASGELIARLEAALTPTLRYAIDRAEGGAVPGPLLGFEVQPSPSAPGPPGEPERLPAGGYRLRLPGDDRADRPFVIDDGDWLLSRIVPTPSGPGFERELYSQVAFGNRPAIASPRTDWRLSVVQNQLRPGPGLRLLSTFERTIDPTDPVLRQARPREIWFEVEGAKGESRPSGSTLRISDRWGYPAPAWSIDVAGWPDAASRPGAAAPVIRAWWRADDEATPAAVVERGRDFRVDDDLRGYAANLDDGRTATIESVRVEDQEVDIGDGTRRVQPCLVVRVSYPKDHPVWARPYGLELRGWEHRFYEDVGKYTGLFWPVTPSQAEAMRRLGLISVSAFRREAHRRGDEVRLDGLGVPDPGDADPPPIAAPRSPVPAPPPLARTVRAR